MQINASIAIKADREIKSWYLLRIFKFYSKIPPFKSIFIFKSFIDKLNLKFTDKMNLTLAIN